MSDSYAASVERVAKATLREENREERWGLLSNFGRAVRIRMAEAAMEAAGAENVRLRAEVAAKDAELAAMREALEAAESALTGATMLDTRQLGLDFFNLTTIRSIQGRAGTALSTVNAALSLPHAKAAAERVEKLERWARAELRLRDFHDVPDTEQIYEKLEAIRDCDRAKKEALAALREARP